MTQKISINGQLTGIRHQSENFLVGTLTTASGEYFTVKGNLPLVEMFDEIVIDGEWETHPKYGQQIAITAFQFANPSPDQKAVADAYSFLTGTLGLKGKADKIFAQYGSRAREILEANPYSAVRDVPGVGIETAEQIADRLEIPVDDPRRIDERVLYCLEKAAENNGHVCLDEASLVKLAMFRLDENDDIIRRAIARLLLPEQNDEKPEWMRTEPRLVHEPGRGYYLPTHWKAERGIPRNIARLLNAEGRGAPCTDEELLRGFPAHNDATSDLLTLSDQQRAAVKCAVNGKVTVITGGPGVGKTTVIRAIVNLAHVRGWEITLCAPTGRAAKRMQEASGYSSATIHRVLAYNPSRGTFRYNESMPISSDIVICDESSMIDIDLMHALLAAIPTHARLVLVGDVDQLPPVGPGAPFRDLIRSEQIEVARLTQIFRQKEGSLIIQGARDVLAKRRPTFGKPDTPSDDLFLFSCSTGDRAVQKIVELLTVKIPERFKIKPEDIQVLSPVRKGTTGVSNLNQALQYAIHGKNSKVFLRGDRVIHTKNNYDLMVYNGDVGYVDGVSRKGGVIVQYPGNRVTYPREFMHQLDLAYASTIHKAQGSEYKAVIVVAMKTRPGFYNRNMFYTAITRGKTITAVVVVEGLDTLDIVLETNEKTRRGFLLERLRDESDYA